MQVVNRAVVWRHRQLHRCSLTDISCTAILTSGDLITPVHSRAPRSARKRISKMMNKTGAVSLWFSWMLDVSRACIKIYVAILRILFFFIWRYIAYFFILVTKRFTFGILKIYYFSPTCFYANRKRNQLFLPFWFSDIPGYSESYAQFSFYFAWTRHAVLVLRSYRLGSTCSTSAVSPMSERYSVRSTAPCVSYALVAYNAKPPLRLIFWIQYSRYETSILCFKNECT